MHVCKCEIIPIMNADYFEIDRLIEDLAKLYSTACATSWFKIESKTRPTPEEFRNKVVEFMKHFEYTLASFPQTPADRPIQGTGKEKPRKRNCKGACRREQGCRKALQILCKLQLDFLLQLSDKQYHESCSLLSNFLCSLSMHGIL